MKDDSLLTETTLWGRKADDPDGHREGSLNVKLNLTDGEMYGGNDQIVSDAQAEKEPKP